MKPELPDLVWTTIKAHFKYLSYITRHKWFVLQVGLRIQVPLGNLLVHDLSKLRPREWLP
jgi:hypothetical protein